MKEFILSIAATMCAYVLLRDAKAFERNRPPASSRPGNGQANADKDSPASRIAVRFDLARRNPAVEEDATGKVHRIGALRGFFSNSGPPSLPKTNGADGLPDSRSALLRRGQLRREEASWIY